MSTALKPHFNYITPLWWIINSSFLEALRKYSLQLKMQVKSVTKYNLRRHMGALKVRACAHTHTQATSFYCNFPVFKKAAQCDWLLGLMQLISCLHVICAALRVCSTKCALCLWVSLNTTQNASTMTDLWRCRIPGLWVKFSSPVLTMCSQPLNRPLTGF